VSRHRSLTRDAIPGPLAFCAFRQQHDRCASHTCLVTRGRWPQITSHGVQVTASCHWPDATNAGVWGRAPRVREYRESDASEMCKASQEFRNV
jgi:hypothetical protein